MRLPRIYYLAHTHQHPTGGQKHTYRHVDILTKNGFDASVVHHQEGFRLTWFENTTRVISYARMLSQLNPAEDFLVLPEDFGDSIADYPGRKIIFNKNIFRGFTVLSQQPHVQSVYLSSEVEAVMAVSTHNESILRLAFPHLIIKQVPIEIDPQVFRLRNLHQKKPQIVVSTKAWESVSVVYQVLTARASAGLNQAHLFTWRVLDGLSEAEVADLLGESLIFLFLNVNEGLGRAPLEALACGCVVAAYDAGPLSESIPAIMRFAHSDIASIVAFLEWVMSCYPASLSSLLPFVEAGGRSVAAFSPENQERAVVTAWSELLNAHPPNGLNLKQQHQ